MTRRRLGGELKRLRESSGFKLEDVARRLECSPSKISRLENGKGIPRVRDVRDMLEAYGVRDGEVRDRLLEWSRTGQAKMWWHAYAEVLTPDFATYLEFEWDAAHIQAYESDLVHGLLQTRDYARSVLTSAWGPLRSPAQVERLVEVRMRRQEALGPDHGLTLRCVLDESTLYRVAGSREILRAQLEHLIGMAEATHVEVRVLPFSAGLVAMNLSPFSRLEFTTGIEDGVVYLERPRGTASDFLFERNDVADYAERMNVILAASLGETESVELIERAVERLPQS